MPEDKEQAELSQQTKSRQTPQEWKVAEEIISEQ